MASTVTYSKAPNTDDALLTFEGDDDEVLADTSAAVLTGDDSPDDLDALTEATYAGKAKTHRRCLWIVIPVLALAAVGAIVGIISSGGGGKIDAAPVALGSTVQGNPVMDVPTYSVEVLKSHGHDQAAFTQGLEYKDGIMYESTGLKGQSSLRKVNITSGEVLKKYTFKDSSIFGEGITLHHAHHIFMLSWKSGRGFIFHQKTFELLKEWKYEGEGWGLTMDDPEKEVYMSDGTHQLRVLEPENLSELRRINVTLKGKPAKNLNEIEWICGEVWANVWLTKEIYRISPTTGAVLSIIDAKNLPLKLDNTIAQDVLNGIAYDKDTGRLWFTGKQWSKMYQVAVNDKSLDLKNCEQTPK